jgi:hypothetical protein
VDANLILRDTYYFFANNRMILSCVQGQQGFMHLYMVEAIEDHVPLYAG